jgi:class 3 adenylate cyclase/tetratricopeptide (TPR) repeat protein
MEGTIMQCPKCQFENREGAKFCKKCGSKIELVCPECSYLLTPDSLFCDECGNDLRRSKEAPTLDYDLPQSYTPKHLVDKILTSRSSIEGERKLVTVFFADVANSTVIFEKLDPEDVHQVMDGCFRIIMNEIHRYEGTVNQFRGDCVMALFGAPLAHEDHAQRACFASLRIQRAMKAYSEDMRARFGFEFKMRIGLNSGPVVVGSIGNDLRMDYTADGDTVNLAMRMESMAAPGNIQISENTYRLIKEYFDCKDLGLASVKGKKESQRTFKLIKSSKVRTRFEASVSKGLVRFVGRQNSMAALKTAWDKAANGSGQVIGVMGEAGVGKSRLLLEFIRSLDCNEFNYHEGRCLQYGSSMAYLPFLDILKSYFHIGEDQREYITKKTIAEKLYAIDSEFFSGSIPAFHDLLSLKIDDEIWLNLEPKQLRDRRFDALKNLFLRLSKERPQIVAVEDLQWIDKTSEDFLSSIINSMAQLPILLILIYRPEYNHQWSNKTYYSKIGLDQLTLESSAKLVSAILEDGDVEPELKDLILNRSAGNPLFVEEFTHTLLENGSIEQKNNQFVLNRNIDEIQVPDTIQGIIAARMDRLEENLKRTMQVASVVGRDFAFRILHTITGMREELKSYLLNLQGLEFIYEKSLSPELQYIFKHALTQEVAYNSLLLEKRKEIHAKIGRAIEELYAERLEKFYEMLAYHYSRSNSLEKAWRYAKLSAEKAEGNFSHREACDFYKLAIGLLNKLPATAENKKEKMKVISLILPPLAFLGFPEGALSILKQGEQLSKDLGDERRLAKLYNAMGLYYTHKGNPQLGMKYSEDAFEEARKNRDIELMPPLAFGLSIPYAQTGEYYKIVDIAPDVIALIEKAKREADSFSMGWNPYSLLCSFCGHGMGNLGTFDQGRAFLEKAIRNAVKMKDLTALGLVEIQYGRFYLAKGDWKASKRHFEKGIKYNEEANWVFGSAVSLIGLGYACAMLGDCETGKRHVEKGLEVQCDSGAKAFLSLAHSYLGWIHLDLGDLKNARSFAEEALRLSQENNEKLIEAGSWLLLGTILGKAVPLEITKAEGCILKGIEIYKELKTKANYPLGYLYLGEFYLNGGKKEKAIDNLKKAEGMFREMGMDGWLVKAREISESI